ncbi:hypothetical protein [Adonisia turfae]|uniref:Uncharacterized protein n=1 Tax=Adonisia turfae CCMR0081 TaxID=2292702 RepID=A0A6M0RGW9_9CYAN|nr:hypothetical protein [Adonisia turfae]NEZ55517.1 hypothetical protein [Adonisia turfae CCMR0081]
MKIWRWGCIGLVVAISACGPGEQATAPDSPGPNGADVTTTAAATAACDPMESQVPLQAATEVDLPFERFDFRPTEVEATESTLIFRGRRYGFTFCKRDRTWGVEALEVAPPVEEDYAEYFESLGDPDYETIASQEQSYQARVRLDASWVEGSETLENDLEQVIFELIKPGDSEPTAQVLYTNTDIIERELGATAGVPTITQTLVTDDALWWSIGFEQGEGASGIATVVQYQLDQDEIVLWQPSELGNAQITDLALTTADDEATLWLGTQYSGEGNPFLPAKGLVAFRPADNTVKTYTVENSPLIGAIPTRLWAEEETLWVATANGVCEIDWTAIDTNDSWACWRFIARTDIPTDQDLYASLLAETPMEQLDGTTTVEVLWLADTDISTPESSVRYEISYEPGITTEISQGADYYMGPEENPDDGYFWWPGQDWSWNGERFVRPWDQVAVNYVGGGPQGIGPTEYESFVADWQAMRGEFELLTLTPDVTEIIYYSAWIDGEDLEPWVTVTEAANAPLDTANPTDVVLTDLKKAAQSN